MNAPHTHRMFETFLRIEDPSSTLLARLRAEYRRGEHVFYRFVPSPNDPPLYPLGTLGWDGYLFAQAYLATLRRVVSPLVRRLLDFELIGWYGFLIHGQGTGVPPTLKDESAYIHLRVSRANHVGQADFLEALPAVCLETRRMPLSETNEIVGVNLRALANNDAGLAWKLLGMSSEWALAVVEAHPPDEPIPLEHLRLFLHYIGNQLAVRCLGIPMP